MGNKQLVLSGDEGMPRAIEQLSKPTQRQLTRDVECVIARGLVANMREQARAYVTNTALQNAGALSELEDHLCKIAPSGAARYKHIVDAYALGAAQAISRW
ncbi:MAG: phosphoenolpyruvate carboxylase [Actinomycetia bacterium]|nr:phosphoenolpyruvate carboxylase [Actinomycetes bacterium]